MRILLSFLLAVSVAAQNPPALDPAKVFAYDASKPRDAREVFEAAEGVLDKVALFVAVR